MGSVENSEALLLLSQYNVSVSRLISAVPLDVFSSNIGSVRKL